MHRLLRLQPGGDAEYDRDNPLDARARRLVVVAGSRRALAAAVRTAGAGRRHTSLTHRLQVPAPL